MDLRNRFNTPCKLIFAINPKILRPPGADILIMCCREMRYISQNACII